MCVMNRILSTELDGKLGLKINLLFNNNNNNNIYYLRCQLHITMFYDTSQAILYEAQSIKTQFINYDR